MRCGLPARATPRFDLGSVEFVNFFERQALDFRNAEVGVEEPKYEAAAEDEENQGADIVGDTWREERE